VKKNSFISMFMRWVGALTNVQDPELTNAAQPFGFHRHGYVGTDWVQGLTITDFYNNTLSLPSVTGKYLIFIILASTKTEWCRVKRNMHGIAPVSIDGGAERLIDLLCGRRATRVSLP
jgi:hypothetical protein